MAIWSKNTARSAHRVAGKRRPGRANRARYFLTYNRGMRQLTILLPFGLPPAEMSADLLRELKAPALSTLLSRAKSETTAFRTETLDGFYRALPHELWLAREFGLTDHLEHYGSPPIASALMRRYGLAPEPGTWFILQPVHIHIARDHLVLTDPRQLAIREHEARPLFDIAASLFAETCRPLLYGDAGTWFIRADDWTALQTSTPDATGGHNIDIWMPKGIGERDWRKVQNEVQMHWFDHPVNTEREARGLKLVNSIWIWGGAPSAAEPAPSHYTDVFNLTGPAAAFEQFAPRRSRASNASDMLAATPERALVVLDNLLEAALSNDWSRWLDAMHALEHDWFAPLLSALKSNAIDRLSLVLTNDTRISRFTITKSSLRKFWVKPTLAPLSP
jgi:hypothetical protein